MPYNDDTNSRLVDAKVLLDKVVDLETRERGMLSPLGIEEEDVRAARDYIDDIVSSNQISLDFHTEASNVDSIETEGEAIDALATALDRLNGIEDPWFWSECEYDMNTVLDILESVRGV